MVSRVAKLSVATAVLAAGFHVAAVKLLPVAITSVVMAKIAKASGYNTVLAAPLPTDKSRLVVKPSPDLLYATCLWDVSHGPVRMAIDPPASYWSLSLFARNTDNTFKISVADQPAGHSEFILGAASDEAATKAQYPSLRYIMAPGTSGVMLARLLVLDRQNMTAETASQQSVRCEPLAKRS